MGDALLSAIPATAPASATTIGRQLGAHGEPDMKGWLFKWTNYLKGYQRRWFVLQNGLLSYYRAEINGGVSTLSIRRRRRFRSNGGNQAEMTHTCRGSISLHGAIIYTVDACTFVVSNGGTQTFHIRAASEIERQCWVTALELAKAKAIRTIESEEDDDEQDSGSGSPEEWSTIVRELQGKLQDLQTCSDLIAKHGNALQRALSELESNAEPNSDEVKSKAVSERATLFRIASNAMINACTEYLQVAQAHGHKWTRLLQHEREQRQRLQEMVETLAQQHSKLEQAAAANANSRNTTTIAWLSIASAIFLHEVQADATCDPTFEAIRDQPRSCKESSSRRPAPPSQPLHVKGAPVREYLFEVYEAGEDAEPVNLIHNHVAIQTSQTQLILLVKHRDIPTGTKSSQFPPILLTPVLPPPVPQREYRPSPAARLPPAPTSSPVQIITAEPPPPPVSKTSNSQQTHPEPSPRQNIPVFDEPVRNKEPVTAVSPDDSYTNQPFSSRIESSTSFSSELTYQKPSTLAARRDSPSLTSFRESAVSVYSGSILSDRNDQQSPYERSAKISWDDKRVHSYNSDLFIDPISASEEDEEDNEFYDAEADGASLNQERFTLNIPTGTSSGHQRNNSSGSSSETDDTTHETQQVVIRSANLSNAQTKTNDRPPTSTMASSSKRPAGRGRRTRVPDKPNYPLNLWSIMKNCIGKDLSKIPMPVNFSEPLSMLQRLAEDFEYSDLLDIAATINDPCEQLAYVAAFTISSYSTTAVRSGKPFNPLLGETFEFDRSDDLGWKLISEQVSHHPPMVAQHCEGRGWVCWQEFTMTSKFRGKYLQVVPLGTATVEFSDGNKYSWRKVTTTVHNIIVGKLWVDQHGDMEIIGKGKASGLKCHLKFIPYSYFSKDSQRRVKGAVIDKKDRAQWIINGQWDKQVEIAPVLTQEPTATQALDLTDKKSFTTIYDTGTARLIWVRVEPPPDSERFYNFTVLAAQLNEMEEGVAPTDSRLRPDQRLMENQHWDEANSEKVRLEEKQRAVRRQREADAERAAKQGSAYTPYVPLWFKQVKGDDGNFTHVYLDNYWEAKKRQDWNQCPSIFS